MSEPTMDLVDVKLAPPAPRSMRIEFTGSGSEYFRIWIVNLLLILVTLGLYLLFFAWVKRYQHGGYPCAGQRARLDVSTARFYGLCLKGLLMYIAFAAVMIAVIGLVALALGGIAYTDMTPEARRHATVIVSIVVGVLYVLFLAAIGPWFIARFQNMVWSGTASEELRFSSRLRVPDRLL